MKTLKERLKWARKQKGWKQWQLAKAAGVVTSTIGNLETRDTENPRHILQIANALGVEAEWLSTGKGPMKKDKFDLINNPGVTYSSDELGMIRRANLSLLIDLMGGLTSMSSITGVDKEQLVYWAYLIQNQVEDISAAMCRAIEESCGKEVGWLDKKHTGERDHKNNEIDYDREEYAELPLFVKTSIQSFISEIISQYKSSQKEKAEQEKKIFRPQLV